MPRQTLASLESSLVAHGRPFSSFKRGDRVRAAPTMRAGAGQRPTYSYVLDAPPGKLHGPHSQGTPSFQPALTPGEILAAGAFEGKYLNDSFREFPSEWFSKALSRGSLSPEYPDSACNAFGIKSRQSLTIWRENGWAPSSEHGSDTDDHYHGLLGSPERNPDERGWFQWYCRYWMGRRIPELDAVQIARWRAFRRHEGAVRGACRPGDLRCRPRQRQALLQWAYRPDV